MPQRHEVDYPKIARASMVRFVQPFAAAHAVFMRLPMAVTVFVLPATPLEHESGHEAGKLLLFFVPQREPPYRSY